MACSKYRWLLLIIVILASILRLYQLGKTPIGLEWDEVAIGYDAYSILKTGRDQFGQFLPITFRSLDDYKPPLYEYATVPSIAIFGLNAFSVRLPTALFGIGAVILTYFLVLELFDKNKEKYLIAFISALFLAVSPWHLQFSRAAFETNLSVTVTLIAVLFFIKGLRSPKLFLLSALFFGIDLFSYHSARIVTPLLLASLFIIFNNSLPSKKNIFGFLAIYAFFLYFFLPIATSNEAQIRFQVTNILDIKNNQDIAAQVIAQDEKVGALAAGQIFHNRRLAVVNYDNLQKIFANYLTHFSPKFLFVDGDVELHHAPGFGMMYFFDLLLMIIGAFLYLKKYIGRRNLILPLWLLFGPIPASVTWQVPHAVRTEIILPSLQIFSALGLVGILLVINHESRLFRWCALISLSTIFVYGLGVYFHQYYAHTNIELSNKWLSGRKEAVEYTESVKNNYQKIIVSPKVDMPWDFWLFYSKYPPAKLQVEKGILSGGWAEERNHFDKYEFHRFNFKDIKNASAILLVGTPKDFPAGVNSLKTIKYLDGSDAIKIVALPQ